MSKNRSKIIFVDDVMSNLDQGRNILKAFYEVYPALSAHKLFEILENVVPDLILLDIEMPEVNGYEAMKMLKKDSRFADIPVIFVTAKNDESSEREGFDLGAVDYITKPFSAPLLLKRIENQLLIRRRTLDLQASQSALQEYADNLTTMVSEKTEEIMELQSVILSTIGDLVEFRDNPTGGHVSRTYRYMRILVDGVCNSGLDYKEQIAQWNLDYFLQSAQLHDVGKITISDLILGKPAKLTSDEFEIMKSHVLAGVEAIERVLSHTKKSDFLDHAMVITGTHHEKWDGSGYPIGLSGASIPLEGRLMALVDVYDALISERPYKKPLPHAEAVEIIKNGAGKHFDPNLVDIFLKVEGEFAKVASGMTEGWD